MKCLIVGCGYVGLPLGAELVRQGHEVFGLRRSAADELKAAGIHPLAGDVTKPETLAGGSGRLSLMLNPVCHWVALFQKPIYYGVWPLPVDWAVSLASGFALILLGIGLYRSFHRKFYFYF